MDNLNPLLIAIVPALLTYLGTKYKTQSEREQQASSAWKQLYDETKERMDDLQKQVEMLSEQMDEMKAKIGSNSRLILLKLNTVAIA